jgi:hypothetical protein
MGKHLPESKKSPYEAIIKSSIRTLVFWEFHYFP